LILGFSGDEVRSNNVGCEDGGQTVVGFPVAASRIPYYSVHAIGFQANYILPAKDFVLFFKYHEEYSAKARVQGRNQMG
jgi:hypothetical protein